MYKLTAFVVLCVVASRVFAEELPEEVKQMLKNLHNNCVGESGVSEDLITAANKGDLQPDEKLKCYMKCLLTSIGVLDDDGVFDKEAYLDLLPDHMRAYGEKVAAACNAEGSNACEVAYNLNVCSYKVEPSKYQLF